MVLLLGGARSGKSAMALRLALASAAPVTYLATAESLDDEMSARIAAHRAERPADWSTLEATLELEAALAVPAADETIVLDCLTMWVSNLLGAGLEDEEVLRRADRAATLAARRSGSTIVVSNEVGWGIVPANPLARRYRDLLGRVNTSFAAVAERCLLVVAGRVLELQDPGLP
jgi:adenosylcobinamide kinase/adenosylcobinamide-phosphate guanylyltransferase